MLTKRSWFLRCRQATALTVGLPLKLLRRANNIDFSQALELFTTHLNTKATRNKCIYSYHLQSIARQSVRQISFSKMNKRKLSPEVL